MNRYRVLWSIMLFSCLGISSQGMDIPVDGYAAVVNDRIITVGDVLSVMAPVEQQIREAYQGLEMQEKLEEAFSSAREALIEQALIIEDFEQRKGVLPEKMIDERVNSLIHDQFGNNRAEFLEALAEERTTLVEWRKKVKEQLIVMISRRQMVADRVSVAPSAIYDVYQARMAEYKVPEKVRLRMIVIQKGRTDQDSIVKREEAERTLERVRSGEDFADLAAMVSEGTKASDGGDWGWISSDDLRPELAEVSQTLTPGETSDVIEVDDAYYIIKIEARKEAETVAFEDAREDIKQHLRQVEEERLYKEWMERLKDKYYVRIF